MEPDNQFQYTSSAYYTGVKLLNARMADFTYDKHAHEEYCIGVTLKGRQDFFCSGANHKSRVGNVIYFNPEEVHDGHAGDASVLEYDMLYIAPEKLIPLMKALGLHNPNHLRLKETLFNDPLLRQQVIQMSQLLHSKASSQIEQESGLIQLAESLVRVGGSRLSFSASNGHKDKLLLRAKDFIHSNLEQTLTVDNISLAANMSKYHFIRLFREQFGITPHQYVLNCRINQAIQALEQGSDITDVALRLGFADYSHLNRKFKRIFGMTPKQYQRQFCRR